MASYANRSNYFVRVKQRKELYHTFSYDASGAARAYLQELRAQGYKPTLGQFENKILVRVRAKGYKPQHAVPMALVS